MSETTTQQNDTRAAVEAAMQHHEQPETQAPTSAPSPVPTEPASAPAPERSRDEAGRFATKAKEPKPTEVAPEAKPKEGTSPEPEAKDARPGEPPRAGPPKNAPLPAAVREAWEQIPDAARQYILKREGEVSRVLSETASARKVHAAFEKTLEPYRDLITKEPMQAVGDLLQTAAVLKRGQPHEKAQLAAQMIAGYDIDIEQLASALEGLPARATQSQQFRDPRVDAIERRLSREDALRKQSHLEEAGKQYRAFSENAEFLETPGVADAMYQEILGAARRGVAMDYQEAYDRVVWSLPETRGVLLERERQKSSTGTAPDKAAIQRAKHAASSVKTEPSMGRVTHDNSVEANIRALLG